jgi:phosphoribosylformylglycinamidine synthase
MKFLAEINIMPHKELLDPQGKAVMNGLNNMGYMQIENIRIGKKINVSIDANSASHAESIAKEACEKLLVNKIMEEYSINLTEINA